MVISHYIRLVMQQLETDTLYLGRREKVTAGKWTREGKSRGDGGFPVEKQQSQMWTWVRCERALRTTPDFRLYSVKQKKSE